MVDAQEFTEYCAALTASAIYNCNRGKGVKPISPDVLMIRSQARRAVNPPPAPAPPRYALPGERPPSSRPPQNVIDRFDSWVRQTGGKSRG